MFDYFGLIAVLASWVIGAFVVIRLGPTRHKTISEHIASTRLGYLLGVAALAVIGALFYLWILGYLVPKLELGVTFIALLTVAVMLQIVAGLVPDDARTWRSKLHRMVAYGEAALFVPLSVLLTISPQTSSAGVIVGCMTLGYFVISVILYTFVPKSRDHYLFFQALYIIVFQVQILVTAYT